MAWRENADLTCDAVAGLTAAILISAGGITMRQRAALVCDVDARRDNMKVVLMNGWIS